MINLSSGVSVNQDEIDPDVSDIDISRVTPTNAKTNSIEGLNKTECFCKNTKNVFYLRWQELCTRRFC